MNIRFASLSACVVSLLFAVTASGDPVFHDDFNGSALQPHWSVPSPVVWEHNVSNGMLNVTGLFDPSSPDIFGNIASMSAEFEPQTDFRVDAWMGWDGIQFPHRLVVSVISEFGGIMASFGYRNDGLVGFPAIVAGASNVRRDGRAPSSGIQQFSITRTQTRFDFFLNGSPFWSVSDIFGGRAARLRLQFVGPYPGTLPPCTLIA